MPSLPDQLQAFHDGYLAVREAGRQVGGGLGRSAFNWHPAPNRWSVGQCLAHLNVAGGLLVPRLEEELARARSRRWVGAAPFSYGLAGGFFVRSLEPGRRPLPAPSVYTPASDYAPEVVLADFERLQERLAALVIRSEGVDLRRVRVVSPVSSWVRFNAAAWFAATLAHERRHLAQARAVRDADGFPG